MRGSRVPNISKVPARVGLQAIESAELRSALATFRMTRSAALLLAVFAAVVISNPEPGHEQIAASLAGFALAIYIARGGRRQLCAALRKNAERLGMRGREAHLHAEALFETLTWQEPNHAVEWLPNPAGTEPCRDAVRELPDITITGIDRERLSHLLQERNVPRVLDVTLLDRELTRASVVPSSAIAPDVVTMNSRVLFALEDQGEPREVTLVYPRDASFKAARVSVLSPLGSALLGLRVGQAIEWPFSDGHRERYRILHVAY
ncbi:MAG TPA: nucleoside diphosphate kinase regulator, partial [Polyangiales bacterium]|nr:nucleoside diphosphate kinase regulator [Polyangiales bacterium]